MTSVLYVNHGLAKACGVQDFGRRHANALRGGTFDLDYVEIDSVEAYAEAHARHAPDVVLFNFMPAVLGWAEDPRVRELPGVRVAVQHLYSARTLTDIADRYAHRGSFEYVVVLDPTVVTGDRRVRPMHRAIPHHRPARRDPFGPVRIGTFGFAAPHKRLDLLARLVNAAFDEAELCVHAPVGHFLGDYTPAVRASVEAELTKPGVVLRWASDFVSETEVVDRLGQNDVNAFLYELNQDEPGVSSSLDYAVAAERPLLLSDCALFSYADPFAYRTPGDNLEDMVKNRYDEATARARALLDREAGRLLRDMEQFLEEVL